MVGNTDPCFPKPRLTSLNVLFCPKPQGIIFLSQRSEETGKKKKSDPKGIRANQNLAITSLLGTQNKQQNSFIVSLADSNSREQYEMLKYFCKTLNMAAKPSRRLES